MQLSSNHPAVFSFLCALLSSLFSLHHSQRADKKEKRMKVMLNVFRKSDFRTGHAARCEWRMLLEFNGPVKTVAFFFLDH